MSRRQEIRKMKQQMARLYREPIANNKLVRARRYGFMVGALLPVIVAGLATLIYRLVTK